MVFPSFAVSASPLRVYDGADLLTDSQEEELLETLDEISERQQCDVAVATVQSLGGKSARTYADDFYDQNDYGMGSDYDGILLLVSISDREWYITTCGYGIYAITDDGRDYIAKQFVSDLTDGDYEEAFLTYADLCDKFLTQANAGQPFDGDYMPSGPLSVIWIPVSILIGFILSLLVTAVMKSELKSVHKKENATGYVKTGSLRITNSKDIFLYRKLDRRRKEQPHPHSGSGSSTHTSSSGRTHGGGGGRF
jgi:uncharacterized protein